MGYFDDSEFEFEEEYVNGINIKKIALLMFSLKIRFINLKVNI